MSRADCPLKLRRWYAPKGLSCALFDGSPSQITPRKSVAGELLLLYRHAFPRIHHEYKKRPAPTGLHYCYQILNARIHTAVQPQCGSVTVHGRSPTPFTPVGSSVRLPVTPSTVHTPMCPWEWTKMYLPL